MSKDNRHIDEILRDKFSDWEAGYDRQEMEEVWNNVEQQIGTQGGQGNHGNGAEGGASGSGGTGIKSLLSGTKGWIVSSVAAAATMGGAAYFVLQPAGDEEKAHQQENQEVVEDEAAENTSDSGDASTARPFDNNDGEQKPDEAAEREKRESSVDAGKSGNSGDRAEGQSTSGKQNGLGSLGKEAEQGVKAGDHTKDNVSDQNAPSKAENAVQHFPVVLFQQDFMKDEQTAVSRPVILLQQQVVCQGDGLAVKAMNFEDHHKAWYKKGSGAFQALKGQANLSFETLGEHELTFKLEKDGETRLEPSVIRVAPLPEAVFDFEKIGYQKVRFRNQSKDAGEFHWKFGDGEKSGQRQPIHYYDRPGSKKVMLKASNEYNCADSMTRTLNIAPFPEPEIPNTITPNGDGKNDEFRIKIEDEVFYHLVIKNSEGEKLFESMNKNRRWDGSMKNNGEACEGGTYHYRFEYRYKGQQEKATKEGRIYLKRD